MRRARRLHRELRFDLAWHLTLANAWLGSLAALAGPPFVYGPVGGGIGVAWSQLPTLGVRGTAYELARGMARGLARVANPLARLSWNRARLILAQNPETVEWLPRRHRARAAVFPNPILQSVGSPGGPAAGRTALFAGRLVPLKGVALALDALALLPGWRLLVAGDGPDRRRLRRRAERLGVTDRVRFLGWLPRRELLRAMRDDASVFLFPSLHDEAGWSVVEALGQGLPVVCLDRGGPPLLTGRAGVIVSAGRSADGLGGTLAAAVEQALERTAADARGRASAFSPDVRRGELLALLGRARLTGGQLHPSTPLERTDTAEVSA